MSRYGSKLLLLTIFSLFTSLAEDVHAQSIMYQDTGGNLHFVDTVLQVPSEYRKQVVHPPKTDQGTGKNNKQKKAKQQKQEKQKAKDKEKSKDKNKKKKKPGKKNKKEADSEDDEPIEM